MIMLAIRLKKTPETSVEDHNSKDSWKNKQYKDPQCQFEQCHLPTLFCELSTQYLFGFENLSFPTLETEIASWSWKIIFLKKTWN